MSEADTKDVVAELDAWLDALAPGSFSTTLRRARDEIVALRHRMNEYAEPTRSLLMKNAGYAEGRADALEEAAQECDRNIYCDNDFCAAAIRALKDQP
jgi:hypothetical protein